MNETDLRHFIMQIVYQTNAMDMERVTIVETDIVAFAILVMKELTAKEVC